MTVQPVSLTAIILTLNEEPHLERAIQSISNIAERVFVVDSGSTDRTVDIARRMGADVVDHLFVNQAYQFQWALDNLPIESDWILRLDADEVLTPGLAAEIANRLPSLPSDVTGVVLKLRYIFQNQKINFGGRGLRLLRIVRRGKSAVEPRWMDEHLVVTSGRIVTFSGEMFDHNLKDLTSFVKKHNGYATREAIQLMLERYPNSDANDAAIRGGVTRQARLKQLLRDKIYNRLPLSVGPIAYFLYRYVLLLGFLDGRKALTYHLLQGLWYRFLVAAKALEYDRSISKITDYGDRIELLGKLTGHNIALYEKAEKYAGPSRDLERPK
ncbi:glycosyltransferase family 2 protein [Bradyrhizobium manausense]|uniref:glycosyltransferase family 2 protein n=1 Tax=Bradyrhizobium manausense TaxID=989370 RepID=UPI001BAA5AE8|nr:glycosyltransferase family 2 protein [Bradyrhizobium manausense]MBR1085962.1 glycosyltransferase family 2 protein [Bradyrhizobium manausense]